MALVSKTSEGNLHRFKSCIYRMYNLTSNEPAGWNYHDLEGWVIDGHQLDDTGVVSPTYLVNRDDVTLNGNRVKIIAVDKFAINVSPGNPYRLPFCIFIERQDANEQKEVVVP